MKNTIAENPINIKSVLDDVASDVNARSGISPVTRSDAMLE